MAEGRIAGSRMADSPVAVTRHLKMMSHCTSRRRVALLHFSHSYFHF